MLGNARACSGLEVERKAFLNLIIIIVISQKVVRTFFFPPETLAWCKREVSRDKKHTLSKIRELSGPIRYGEREAAYSQMK